jgi:hypothetical protein
MRFAFDSSTLPTDVTVATDYASARRAFLEAATERGLTVTTHAHPLPGLQGEPLAIDIAWLGPREARRVMVSLSGTHGVEGLYGSGCQVTALRRIGQSTLPSDTAIVFVHAVNPYGFSWVRRVDADNIDVNRNFVDFSNAPANPAYAAMHAMLLPAEWTAETLPRIRAEVAAAMQREGLRAATAAITGGQRTHPDGLFFGGTQACWSNRTLSASMPGLLTDARAICVLDHHTGLGPEGHTELICRHPVGSLALELARKWWGSDVTATEAGESQSEVLGGNVRMAFDGWCPNARVVVTTALEVGTVSGSRVLAALVADNWLHQRGDTTSPLAETIRRQVRDAFFVDTAAWHVRSIGRALEIYDRSLDGLQQIDC